jgi:hypothetical protein
MTHGGPLQAAMTSKIRIAMPIFIPLYFKWLIDDILLSDPCGEVCPGQTGGGSRIKSMDMNHAASGDFPHK